MAVALMPVLLLVSVVILLAGVIVSQHRLPLAMPAVEGGLRVRLSFKRFAVLVPIAISGVALTLAVGITMLFVLPGARRQPMPVASVTPMDGGQRGAPAAVDVQVVDSAVDSARLSGIALLGAAGVAIVLIGLAVVGLVGVAVVGRTPLVDNVELTEEEVSNTVDSLTRAAEMGLAAMNAPGQDARTAVIACYVAMEAGLAADRAAAPLISDTPKEVLERAFDSGVLHDDGAHELVALFEEARFSPHAMLGWQRIRAEQLLRLVLADLRARDEVSA
ncbi:DUF4129 domain-containing protein [Nocardia alba]|uniref:Uncharacterized protein DUF4129 n=1 Tax=Nocardia alba TaxID=225051 RepID=A0A4R1FD17_9NOCA|nr:DUF4129 domain-containing protein [Nocardia alba]TCJ89748.1 uncharacterized protein DUF4129 [Nocardia alba]